MDLGAAADGIARVSLAGNSLASLAVAVLCAGLAALGWFSRKKWYLFLSLGLLLADLVYLALVISNTGIRQLPMSALVVGAILAVGVTAIVGLGRCRPRIQFRLRTLLIAILVLSLPLSWFAMRMERARRQREAVAAIERLGGSVVYDWERMWFGPPDPPTRYPAWLLELLGDDFFFDVVAVEPLPSDFCDDDAPCLEELVNLKQLPLFYTEITDAALEYLKGLVMLQDLSLAGTNVTDAGLEHLHGLASLKSLQLVDSKVTPEGVKKLQEALPDCKIEYDASVADRTE